MPRQFDWGSQCSMDKILRSMKIWHIHIGVCKSSRAQIYTYSYIMYASPWSVDLSSKEVEISPFPLAQPEFIRQKRFGGRMRLWSRMLTIATRHFEVLRRLPGLFWGFCPCLGPVIPITRGHPPRFWSSSTNFRHSFLFTHPYRHPYNNPTLVIAHNFSNDFFSITTMPHFFHHHILHNHRHCRL